MKEGGGEDGGGDCTEEEGIWTGGVMENIYWAPTMDKGGRTETLYV